MCVYFSIMAHLLLLAARENQRKLPKPRVFRDRTQPLDSLDDDKLVSRYRLSRHCIICRPVRPADLERSTTRSNALSVSTQVLVALRYFATGSFQQVAGNLHGISQSSVSRCVTGVGNAQSRRTLPGTSHFQLTKPVSGTSSLSSSMLPPPSAEMETEEDDELSPPADSNNDSSGARVRSRLIERRFGGQQ